jgi:hypothetical protein
MPTLEYLNEVEDSPEKEAEIQAGLHTEWFQFDTAQEMDDFVMKSGDLKFGWERVNAFDNVVDRERKITEFEEWGLEVKDFCDIYTKERLPRDLRARLYWAYFWLMMHRD